MKVKLQTIGQEPIGKHPLYGVWLNMRRRCNDPKRHNYKYYGGRGIKVCDEWNSFKQFLSDMGTRPEGYELDRIDNNGDYEPSNCRWAKHRDNTLNRSTSLNPTKGVRFKAGKYEAGVTRFGKFVYLGRFSTQLEALEVVRSLA